MKCWNCKKTITHSWRVPVITRAIEKFRDFCDECYQKVKERREMENCDYCGRLTETTLWAHDGDGVVYGDEENLCESCLKWMVAHGEVLFELEGNKAETGD